jgi:hypothetical protein
MKRLNAVDEDVRKIKLQVYGFGMYAMVFFFSKRVNVVLGEIREETAG